MSDGKYKRENLIVQAKFNDAVNREENKNRLLADLKDIIDDAVRLGCGGVVFYDQEWLVKSTDCQKWLTDNGIPYVCGGWFKVTKIWWNLQLKFYTVDRLRPPVYM